MAIAGCVDFAGFADFVDFVDFSDFAGFALLPESAFEDGVALANIKPPPG
jgi:hypothetical protein